MTLCMLRAHIPVPSLDGFILLEQLIATLYISNLGLRVDNEGLCHTGGCYIMRLVLKKLQFELVSFKFFPLLDTWCHFG